MILVDTSVWIDHLNAGVPELARALDGGEVLMHPFVLGELACGRIGDRAGVLPLLARLPRAPAANNDEALDFIEQRRLMGIGIGYIDVHLLASTALAAPALLWTRDRRLLATAADLGLAHRERN